MSSTSTPGAQTAAPGGQRFAAIKVNDTQWRISNNPKDHLYGDCEFFADSKEDLLREMCDSLNHGIPEVSLLSNQDNSPEVIYKNAVPKVIRNITPQRLVEILMEFPRVICESFYNGGLLEHGIVSATGGPYMWTLDPKEAEARIARQNELALFYKKQQEERQRRIELIELPTLNNLMNSMCCGLRYHLVNYLMPEMRLCTTGGSADMKMKSAMTMFRMIRSCPEWKTKPFGTKEHPHLWFTKRRHFRKAIRNWLAFSDRRSSVMTDEIRKERRETSERFLKMLPSICRLHVR